MFDAHIGRRSFFKAGLLGFMAPKLFGDIKDFKSVEGSAKSVIFIYLPGGMAAQESFDPKPLAPTEYKGPMESIQTNAAGTFLNEKLAKTATVADKLTIIRSMTHGEAAHERGTHNVFTGYRPSPALNYPSMGAVVTHEFGSRNNLPAYICIPNLPNEFAGTGYLSSSYGAFSLGSDPARDNFKVRDLASEIGETRFSRRRSTLDLVNENFLANNKNADNVKAMNTFYNKAYDLISSTEAQEAFKLDKESSETRDRYGKNTAGARMLLSRRLVEAGARFVTMTYGGWDMHDNIANGINSQMPAFDQGFAALISDLSDRGLLDSTLVCVVSEFGRTPKINGTAGRDHWPRVFSSVLAGGGIKGGITYGTSDPTGSEPDQNPVEIPHWAGTIYHLMGINPDKELMAPGDRPIEIVDFAKVIKDIIV
mgnify:FL=1|tara:strand:- start:305 stop:1576 length:1272 start_codon:yes stop_codon:yes gene_type:complete